MASEGTDLSSLTPEQQSSLEQYIAFTNQDVAAALPILRRAEWNVQIAIARFFDGEPETDILQDAINQAAPRDIQTSETLVDGFDLSRPRTSRQTPAPRIVPPPNPDITYRPGFPLNLLFTPFSIATAIFSRIFRTLASFIPFLPALLARLSSTTAGRPSRRALLPRDTAARFIREFEEEYGSSELPFVENGYAHALDEAKRDLKYLLVILFSPEHDDTASYVRETLLSPDVVSFLRNKENNIILWGGSVRDSEAYQVASAFKVTKFPHAALIANSGSSSSSSSTSSSSGMAVIAPLSGFLPPNEFLAKIRRAIDSHSATLGRLRSERAERDATRTIREQQDSAYERSLAQDRERARQRREEADRRKAEEEKAKEAEEEQESIARKARQWRQWRAARILPEPGADDPDAVRVSLRLIDGERWIRRFAAKADLEEVYACVACVEELQEEASEKVSEPENYDYVFDFRLVAPMPRTVYEPTESGTLREKLGRSANLIVETLDEYEE